MERIERILVVDDDPRNVRLLEGIFRTAGYAVDKALGGEEALARVQASLPDLVLLDVMMPGVSGHEVCVRLKGNEKTRSIPIMLVTALSALEDKVEGLDIGADDFVSKPVNRVELLAKTRSLLRIKSLHDQVARAGELLAQKNAELVKLEQLKETLVQMIVHDLKNPLTAIMGNLGLILRSPEGPAARTEQRAKVALESCRAMMRLALDLLDISRLEENKMVLSREPLEMRSLAGAAIQETDALAAQARIVVTNDIEGGLSPAWADRDLLTRILANLLSNAIKHTPEGGSVSVGAAEENGGVVLWVQDTGEGIPEEYQDAIFEKFSQAEVKRRGLKSDRGLGLTFCKMAVEAHAGRIWVESVRGKGSTFRVFLPGAPPAHETEGPVLEGAVPVGAGEDGAR